MKNAGAPGLWKTSFRPQATPVDESLRDRMFPTAPSCCFSFIIQESEVLHIYGE